MPIYKITESVTIWRTYAVEAVDDETAVEDYLGGEVVDEDLNTDTEVVAVEDEDGLPVGTWSVIDNRGHVSDGDYDTREEALTALGVRATWSPLYDESKES